MTKNNKRDELIDELVRWAEEDNENRSVLVLAEDESGIRLVYNGRRSQSGECPSECDAPRG